MMRSIDSIAGTHNKKYRGPLSNNTFYQPPPALPPPPPPHSRIATLRPQSEYGFSGIGGYPGYLRGYSSAGGGGGGGSSSSGEWRPSLGALTALSRPGHPRKRPCSALLIAAAFLAALAVLAVAGLALYMGAFRTEAADPIIAFEGRLRVRRSVSAGAIKLTPNVVRLTQGLKSACSQSPLSDAVAAIDVHSVDSERLVAFFRLYLDRRKIPTSMTNIEEVLRSSLAENALLKSSPLRLMNVDPASIAIKRDTEHTYRPETVQGSSAESKAPPPTSPSQNTKEKVLQTRMGVIRKTAVTNNSTNIHKPTKPSTSDEPDINVDELPVIQGSFQITKTDADITENKKKNESENKTTPQASTTEGSKPKVTQRPDTRKTLSTSVKIGSKSPSSTTLRPTKKITTTTIVPSTEENKSKVTPSPELKKPEISSELPKLDTLFAVPSYDDQEPWRPIRPGDVFSTDPKDSELIETDTELPAEDRMGVAEVIEDLGALEGVEQPQGDISIMNDTEFQTKILESLFMNSAMKPAGNVWSSSYTEPSVDTVYTSFSDPNFSSTFKQPATLGSNNPVKPHPIPVNKLPANPVNKGEVESVSYDSFFSNSGENSEQGDQYIPPKDKLSTVAINIEPMINSKDELVNLHGGVIVKKHNITKQGSQNNNNKEFIKMDTVQNDKMAVTPLSFENNSSTTPMKWELVNGTNMGQVGSKHNITKQFNETLQALVVKDEDFPSKRNDTNAHQNNPTLVKSNRTLESDEMFEYKNKSSQKPSRLDSLEKYTVPIMMKNDTRNSGNGSVLPVEVESLVISSTPLIPTLLPVKSNSGIGRPLRPRPKLPPNGEDRSFPEKIFPFLSEVKNLLNSFQSDSPRNENDTNDEKRSILNSQANNLNKIEKTTEIPKILQTTSMKTEVVTSFSSDFDNSTDLPLKIVPSNLQPAKKIDISEKFRFPKTHDPEDSKFKDKIEQEFDEKNDKPGSILPTATEFIANSPSTHAAVLTEQIKSIMKNFQEERNLSSTTPPQFIAPIDSEKPFQIPNSNDSVRIKIHVESSVSSNKNFSSPYLSDEDILKMIKTPIKFENNPKYEMTGDKLKNLASIATISDSHNASFFNSEDVPDETVISTKAVSSNYKVNNAGFKILTKTFNKIPGNYKDDEKKNHKYFDDPPPQIFYETTRPVNDSDECESKNLTLKCESGLCLPETARCNRLLDCPGGEDEKDCTCADYLRSQFLLRKICDGILDCWDFSDENNCEWCNPNQYVCSQSRQCIDKDKICDGFKDCPYGDDEKQCVTVAMSQEDANSYPYSKEGYIMVQKQGRWGRLCVQNFDKVIARSHSSLQIADLGRAVCRAMTYTDYQDIDRVIEDAPEEDPFYFSLHYGGRSNSGRGGLAFRRSSCSRGHVAKVVCSQLQCGMRPQAAAQQARIVGGGNAGAGSWPWQAALYKEGDFQCGATLISDKWLVSAGHCFYHAQEDYWVARLGALRRGTTFPSPYEQLKPISSIILHPGYIDSGFINDIALLKMSGSISFSDYVRPICLPPPGSDIDDNRRCTVIGWGQLFEVGRIFPDTLQEVELPIISTGECRKRTLFLPLYRITDDMFCAGFDRGGRDACLGDSGGPLMCQEQDNQWYLYGVTSNGYGCARANRPGVYTKVGNYVNWIQTTMQIYDERSFDNVNNSYKDLDVSESRRIHRHFDKCRGHRCPLGECLPPTRICNGFMECSDGSDEKDCK